MNGVILVNKEENMTSRDVVNKICHIFNTKKVGHTGTLDPLAKGVLVVTIGKYTKLNEDLTSTFKEYIATMKLGINTDTLDITGKIISKKNVNITEDEIRKVIMSYKKKYLQVVPAYSAVKVNGKKLYEYARNNEEVILPKREVEIKEIEILSIDDDLIKFKCLVSKGTYIRSLIRDIGNDLNTYACMTDLIRTRQGIFNIDASFTLEDIKNNKYELLNIEQILDVEKVVLDDALEHKVINGMKIEYKTDKNYILFVKEDKEICLYKKDNNIFRMHLKI